MSGQAEATRRIGAPSTGAAIADRQHTSDLRQLLVYSGIALAVMIVPCLALGRLMAGRALRPLRAMVATARDMCADNLHERLRVGDSYEASYDEFTQLAETAHGVVPARRPEAERRGVELDARLDAAALAGDPNLVESLVANLVDNALRYNLPGGRVEISTATSGARAAITVSNTGAVIRADEVDRIFQPFQRLGDARTRRSAGPGQEQGHGLGLAIVRAIAHAHAHGAALTARTRPLGGLDVEVGFPVRAVGPVSGSGRRRPAHASTLREEAGHGPGRRPESP